MKKKWEKVKVTILSEESKVHQLQILIISD